VGQCHGGRMTCSDQGILSECLGQVLPSPETCNGLDDDCNGAIDNLAEVDAGESLIDAGPAVSRLLSEAPIECMTTLPGLCAYGRRTTCQEQAGDAGAAGACVPILSALGVPEVCNNIDDNCDGLVDNDLNNLGRCLLTDVTLKGECSKGYNICTKGALTCESLYKPTTETCNGLDDDCDGVPDNAAICPPGYYCAGIYGCQYYYCPYVFAWDGHQYRYESTVGGASLIGRREHLVDGRVAEFAPISIRLGAAAVDFSDGLGRARAKIVVGDDEIAYLDRARLGLVYHPPGHEVLASSSMQWSTVGKPDPRELYALATAALRAPLHATWKGVRDVTESLARGDERAAYSEVTTENWYELDFGPIERREHARLVIDGWKLKMNRNLGAGVAEQRPRLEVLSRDGVWTTALELGAPRGDRKAVVVDLSELDVPEGRWHFRLWTGTHEGGKAMWYLDRVRLTEEAPAEIRVVDLAATRAELAFSGAPTVRDASNHDHPLRVDDDGRGSMPGHEQTWGSFTRYGDVGELLATADDRLVVMRRGDGVELFFDGIAPPSGDEQLTLLLEVEALYKPRTWIEDGRTTAVMETAEPLPYHGMLRYPPTRPKPVDDARAAYLRDWQTRGYERRSPRRVA
jgi:hypothetical protein